MIHVVRTIEPKSLINNRDKWLSEYLKAIEELRKDPTNTNKKKVRTTENKYKHRDVKNGLKDMFFNKCAYCESFIGHVNYGHIEHFKPKSKFPNDCFEWNNLFLACEICNGKQFKSDKFPTDAGGGPFINPSIEDPFDHFNFEYDLITGTANVLGKSARGILTELELGLNRPDLVKHRSRIVRRIIFIAVKAAEGDAEALDEMKKLLSADDEYSAFSITVFKKFGL